MTHEKRRIRYRGEWAFVAGIFMVSWISLAIFSALFIKERANILNLKASMALLEKRANAMDHYKRAEIDLRDKRSKQETDALNYVQWQFLLKEEAEAAGQRLTEWANKLQDKSLAGLLYYNAGLSYTVSMDFDSAIRSFEKAVRLNQKDGNSYYNLGLLYSSYLKDNARAVKCYKDYLKIVPEGPKSDSARERIKIMQGLKIER